MDDARKIFTVTELNREIKLILENAYPKVWLEGEISNIKTYPSGHIFFSKGRPIADIRRDVFRREQVSQVQA
jgi:exodeoxyribonuclease VII large subunit